MADAISEPKRSWTGEEQGLTSGVDLGEARETVETSDAAMVRRMWCSVLKVSMVTQATTRVSMLLIVVFT